MNTNDKLERMQQRVKSGEHLRIMILGLGSVGNYLLTYLLSDADENVEIIVAGRNETKMRSDVNVAMVAALIREQCKGRVSIAGGVDFDDVSSIVACLAEYHPDIIVNSSRVYSGLKYGSISWHSVRAYGIWTPLSVRYIRNIMAAYEEAACNAIVINTSYSDVTIPWLKSAGRDYPDFGSGNLNHIVPRLKLSAAKMAGIEDFWEIEVELATAHFHDVVISKEGQDEGVRQLLKVSYGGKALDLDYQALLSGCAIDMPVDQKRNMMNASSNYGIIRSIVNAVCNDSRSRFFSPGAFGEIGGYPVVVDGTKGVPFAAIDVSVFNLDEMRSRNRDSIALDGVENVFDGKLVYTDALLEKAKAAFDVCLPKEVAFDDIDEVSTFIIREIIEPELARRS